MKIERVVKVTEITLTLERDEGWVFVAALRRYADDHVDAAYHALWHEWATDLDRKLRQSS